MKRLANEKFAELEDNKAYISHKWHTNYKGDTKARLAGKTHRQRRYEERSKFYKQNNIFKYNKKYFRKIEKILNTK